MKEKMFKKIIFAVPEKLYNEFKNSCEKEYKTMSRAIRDFMIKYIKNKKK